jgi:uncharacterized protein (DUF433 family)
MNEVVADYPDLERDDILAALAAGLAGRLEEGARLNANAF